jgi:hypothetical protein
MNFWDTSDTFDFEKNKADLINNLDYLTNMSVQEQTLYKKWIELNEKLTDKIKLLPMFNALKEQIWQPSNIMDKDTTIKEIEELEPYVELAEDIQKWTYIRKLISSMEFTANPGRNVKAYVKDRVSNKILGVISLGSDIACVAVRDKYIGWSKDNKFKEGKLNNTTIGTSIIPTQPLGYNFLGGKLVAALTTSPVFRKEWKDKYNDTLIAVGTTALYGASSQYNGIPHFKTLGESAGKMGTKPDNWIYKIWSNYLKKNYVEEYKKAASGTAPKQRILALLWRKLGINHTIYHHGFKRGVYLAQMYENGNDYLCSKINEAELQMKPKFEQGDAYTIKWWKDKAIKRYTTLYNDNRIKNETLYYTDIIGMTWEQCKGKYLQDVGR